MKKPRDDDEEKSLLAYSFELFLLTCRKDSNPGKTSGGLIVRIAVPRSESIFSMPIFQRIEVRLANSADSNAYATQEWFPFSSRHSKHKS